MFRIHPPNAEGGAATISKFSKEATLASMPPSVIKSTMSLHERAVPGALKAFAHGIHKAGLMREVMVDIVQPQSDRRGLSVDTPECSAQAFFASTFLSNDEARQFAIFSEEGRIVGFAQVGKFAPQFDDISCTISNLTIDPGLPRASREAIVRQISRLAIESEGEASLITQREWSSTYSPFGFEVDEQQLSPRSDLARKKDTPLVRCRLRRP